LPFRQSYWYGMFDLAGRVFAGSPAPTNLVIPPYHYAGSDRLVIGADGTKAV